MDKLSLKMYFRTFKAAETILINSKRLTGDYGKLIIKKKQILFYGHDL